MMNNQSTKTKAAAVQSQVKTEEDKIHHQEVPLNSSPNKRVPSDRVPEINRRASTALVGSEDGNSSSSGEANAASSSSEEIKSALANNAEPKRMSLDDWAQFDLIARSMDSEEARRTFADALICAP